MEQATQQIQPSANAQTQTPQTQNPNPISQASESGQAVKPKKSLLKWIIIAIVSLLILGGIYYWIF